MKILVTGGAGFIGSHLLEALLADDHSIATIDNFNDFYDPALKRYNFSRVSQRIRLYEADICDQTPVSNIVQSEKPDVVIHLAARAGVRPSVRNPELYIRTNVLGTFNLLEAARLSGVERFVFASSSSVYGATRELPFKESQALLQTLSPYAATKLAGEQLCSNYSYLYGIRTVCLRLFTVYGPRQRPDLSIHRFTHLIAHDQPIEVYGDGSARRDFTYIDDTIQGVLASLRYNGAPFDIFNLGENTTIALSDVIQEIESSLGKKATINYLPAIPGDMLRTYADISKAKSLLGYRPSTSLRAGIPRFVEWYLQNLKI
jgi:UDP-glucuronate 4-epimerase